MNPALCASTQIQIQVPKQSCPLFSMNDRFSLFLRNSFHRKTILKFYSKNICDSKYRRMSSSFHPREPGKRDGQRMDLRLLDKTQNESLHRERLHSETLFHTNYQQPSIDCLLYLRDKYHESFLLLNQN
jgi:hypothetical protein